MNPALVTLLGIVPDIAERIIDAVLGRKTKETKLTDILSELELLELRRKAALSRARAAVKKKGTK